ncbi:hypothetical protein L195_g059386 [Trifolium pratense]|uniref:Uncharacterized protein n=1 Tax=Trifolium pratense TaxID=57577 RepID=A0A2K3JXW7_TRIPR|nr:hypothetical protein L195_g059386 [Trifolium pratense]
MSSSLVARKFTLKVNKWSVSGSNPDSYTYESSFAPFLLAPFTPFLEQIAFAADFSICPGGDAHNSIAGRNLLLHLHRLASGANLMSTSR